MSERNNSSKKNEGRFGKLFRRYIVHPLMLIIIIIGIGIVAWLLSLIGDSVGKVIGGIWSAVKSGWYLIPLTLIFALLADLLMKPLLSRLLGQKPPVKRDRGGDED